MIEFEKEEDRIAFLDGIKEIERSFVVIEAERGTVKDIIGALNESLDIPKPVIRKVASIYFKKNASIYQEETDAVKGLHSALNKPVR